MSRKEEVYKPALIGKNIPVLTLDNKWHKLFTQTGISPQILKKEEELNELLKRQGKLTTDSKDIRRLKAKLMEEIVSLMGDDDGGLDEQASKKQDENKRLIQDCNDKLDAYQDELLDLEKDIQQTNYDLMLMSMECCYESIQENTQEIQQIEEWINKMRIELKKNVVRKQEKEMYNQALYTYMHDIFGPEVIDIFDMKYNPGETPLKVKSEEKP